MQDIHDHLAPAQQAVRHVLPRTDGHASVNHSPIWNISTKMKHSLKLNKFNYEKLFTRTLPTKRDKEGQLKKYKANFVHNKLRFT
jgi:hypothetical protein